MECPIDENLSEIVRDYKLETRYEGSITVHLHNDPDTPPSGPQRQERWKKVRTIGRGGQSEVILETCVGGGRHYTERAVKKIRLQGDSKRRYESELRAIVKFSHDRFSKHFVKSLGWFASSTKLYIVMEYFPAGDLHNYVRKHQGLPEEDCRQITCQLLSAIAAMHTEGFAHRDIKPQNILIHSHPQPYAQSSWWVKLGDFGISKRISGGPNITTSSVGTMLYMAPELFNVNCSDIPSSDYREADFWSLGITIFFILTNAVPFQTPASTIQFAQNSGEPFPRACLDHHGVTEEGQAFVRETLRPVPGTRLDYALAMDHAWIQPLFPDAPASGTRSRSSTISSRRGSIDDDGVAQGLTTEVSTLSSQPASQLQFEEGYHAFNPPKHEAESQGRVEIAAVDEAPGDAYNGTRNGPFARSMSEMSLDIKQLHDAVMLGRFREVKMLLDLGVNPAALHHGQLPLHTSARRGDVEVTRLLCDRRVDIEAKGQYSETALMAAAVFEKSAVIELLLEKGANIEAKDNHGQTALIVAAADGKCAIIKLLLEKGADIEAKDERGRTALITAAADGKCSVIKVLLEKGADIEAKDKRGQRALMIAIAYRRLTVVELLLEKGADIEAKDKRGRTALITAAAYGRFTVVELLLEKGADIEGKDRRGRTALIIAAAYEKFTVVELLLEKGADVDARNTNSETLLTMAQTRKQKHLVELFLQYRVMR